MRVMWWTAIALCLAGTRAGAQEGGYPPPDTPPAAVANAKVAWADVLRVDPIYGRVQTSNPREECDDVPVERGADNGNKAAGTVLGAIVGGVLGNTVGKGDGRKAATVAGAVAGGAIGHQIEKNQRDDRYGWRISIDMDNGRRVTVTQRDNPDIRDGDRVRVANGRVERY